MNRIENNLIELGNKYNFTVKVFTQQGRIIVIQSNDIDGDRVNWIKYDTQTNKISILGNTDQCNLWFYKTRKDLTPEKIISFVKDLNVALELGDNPIMLKTLIDPEDWQEIANIYDAYEDDRYINN